ncbi:MAG: hypothetical protein JSW40_00260 [Candidatus Omnitrophota bacterium]|nr:MAG: hypothetical protein JSW40_00260 [Candidatus Omnitrophota bacterium]
MNDKRCIGCSEYKNCKDSFTSWIFFIIGIIATVAIRVVTVLIHMDPLAAKVAWYIGVGGFFIFFIYKFRVSQARVKIIVEKNLVDKINHKEQFTGDDYNFIGQLLCSISSRKERINYFFIFGLSALALLLALYMDFFK